MLPSRMPSIAAVKSTVKSTLKGRWPEVIAVGLLPLFAFYFFNLTASVISSLLKGYEEFLLIGILLLSAVFVVLPLFFGVLRYFWRITDGAEEEISTAFYFFTNKFLYAKSLKLTLVILFKIGLVFFLCLIPFFAVSLFSRFLVYDIFKEALPVWAINISAFKSLFYNLGSLFAFLISLRYYLIPVIAILDENLLVLEAVHISTTLAKRSLSSFLGLIFSCLGWIVLSVFVLPQIYTMPFLLGCYVVHSRFAIVNYNLNIEFQEKNRFNA